MGKSQVEALLSAPYDSPDFDLSAPAGKTVRDVELDVDGDGVDDLEPGGREMVLSLLVWDPLAKGSVDPYLQTLATGAWIDEATDTPVGITVWPSFISCFNWPRWIPP